MKNTFDPQFHKCVAQSNDHGVWMALPHPRTLVSFKAECYKQWELEERLKLQEAGEELVSQPGNDQRDRQ